LASTFCAAHRGGQEASRPVQDPDLDSLRLRNPLQGYHWLGLVRQSCMTSRSATRWFRAWHGCPERELLPFRPLLQHRRLDGKPPVQRLLERDSRSGSRSSVHCSDDRMCLDCRWTLRNPVFVLFPAPWRTIRSWEMLADQGDRAADWSNQGTLLPCRHCARASGHEGSESTKPVGWNTVPVNMSVFHSPNGA